MNSTLPDAYQVAISERAFAVDDPPAEHWSDMMSVYYLYAVPLDLPPSTIVDLLPTGLSAKNPEAIQPFYIFGRQNDMKLKGIPLPGLDYQEASLAFTNMFLDDGTGPYAYWVCLWCNDKIATKLGQELGYPKHYSSISDADKKYSIIKEGTSDILVAADIKEEGTPQPLSNFPILKSAGFSNETFISLMNGKQYVSKRVSSTYSYLVPTLMEVNFTDPSLPGLENYSVNVLPLSANKLGGFRVVQQADWRFPTAKP